MINNVKNKILMFLILFISIIICPSIINAETKYNTMNLKQALADEEIAEEFTNYKETDNQIIIYMFRGKNCPYCRSFLSFLNGIADEYSKYFKLVSYEVWNDSKNSELMNEVSTYLGQKATGVPYIIIGEKVFAGYTSSYDESIKNAIMDLYNTKQNKRYDVMDKMKKDANKTSSGLDSNNQVWLIIICNFVFITVASLLVMAHFNNKYNVLYEKINVLTENNNKTQKKANKNKE